MRGGRWARPLLLVLLVFLLGPAAVLARPGGGEGYSGGGDGGGGGGGGGGGELIFFLIRIWFELVIRYPAVGIPLTIVIIVVVVRFRSRVKKGAQSWDSAPPPPPVPPLAAGQARAQDLDAIRQLDPDFSSVLFQDFAYALYARAHQARASRRDLDALAPYLSEAARAQLAQRPPVGVPVTAVVVGAMRVLRLSVPAPGVPQSRIEVLLDFESNITLGEAGSERTQYVRERWLLVRAAGARTKPPEQAKSFHCPNCGAPFDPAGAAKGNRCEYCGEVVSGGRFDWSAESIELVRLEERPPALTSTVEEVGTGWSTLFHPDLPARRIDLQRDDPAATDEALAARLRLIYDELNAAWTNLDLAPVRPYVSDGLFDYLQYWIDAYRRQGLRNVLEGMRITEITLVKIVRDRWFDAVTFRVWGAGRDSTVRQATGDVVAGNPRADRFYSEYWTLIRGAGVRGAPRTDKSCPNCGAPLNTNMAGQCQHCGAKITSGEFDWVLSKIEQDDSYTG